MKIGTRSLLFGVHQFLWHPLTVAFAWRKMYRRWPDRWEWLAIFLHDAGYWGSANMDGREGRHHPYRSACFAVRVCKFFRASPVNMNRVGALICGHSRSYANSVGISTSLLCWPDKLSIIYEPRWFYILRATLSGELTEFRSNAIAVGHISPTSTCREWFDDYKSRVINNKAIVMRLKRYAKSPLGYPSVRSTWA